MNVPAINAPTAQTLEAARLLLSQLGVSAADLISEPIDVPTFAVVIPDVRKTLSFGTLRTYNTHFNRIENEWADRRLDEPTKPELVEMAERVKSESVANGSRHGRGAVENFVGAVRCIYRYAEDHCWIRPADNPSRQVAKPSRRPSARFAIPPHQLADIVRVAACTGDDPELDCLILRLHTETACRRGGALALTPSDLDVDQCLVRLHEKGETVRWQPVSPTLMRHLVIHARERRAPHSERLLRYRNGKPITSRRYDHLWSRIGEELPWVAVQGITIHWLRHTTLTWVERHFGFAVTRQFAGHDDKEAGTTATYVKSNLLEVGAAVAVMTGERHPLVPAYQPDVRAISACAR
ncbi:tyrosine-type recombinase/integrase [Nocardia sp. ET3-3]|uniref:Tyrosine-type recombinase/integrase n=1 Tax=Nocardia terrae TaxID=2675851 RepID=A0A7K1UNG1_9NOCA|nr:site-specific integrase [Nocardia terrae]MVU75876.1 tyrosine-type recombinase/integrase [Nocardia terrae]